MCTCTSKISETKGQASVEAAFLIPVVFTLLLLLIQPGILLYNHMVMQAAASEGCRLLATKTDVAGSSEEKVKGYILRRLGAVPPQDNFHIHSQSCSWEIDLVGDEGSTKTTVTITNKVKLLPLFDGIGRAVRLTNGEGEFVQRVSVSAPTQPDWVASSEEGLSPQAWVERWS